MIYFEGPEQVFILLCPEIVIKAVPSSEFASLIDQHRRFRATIVGKLLVSGVRAHQGQLDRIDGVGLQDLSEEACIDHSGFGSVSTHQMDGLWLVFLPLGCVLVNNFA